MVRVRFRFRGQRSRSRSHRHDEGVQAVAHLVRCVELSEDHGVGGCLAEVTHPELGGLKVWRVDDKLLQGCDQAVRVHRGEGQSSREEFFEL